MPAIRKAALPVAVALLLAASAARGESVAFTQVASVYADEKEGSLKTPEGVACADSGAVVVADSGNGRLVTYTFKDGSIRGGTPLKPAQIGHPTRAQFDSKGNVLVLDRKARRIVRLDASGAFLGNVEIKGSTGKIIPASFKLDGSDNLYVLDAATPKVMVLDPSGNLTRQLDLPGEGAVFTDICVDAGGNLYAVEATEATLWSAEKGATSFKALTKSLKGYMSFPAFLTSDKGRLFVVDQNGNGIVVLGLDGTYQGRQLSIGRGDGYVYYPSQLCIDASGDAFLADRGNNRIQVFTTAK